MQIKFLTIAAVVIATVAQASPVTRRDAPFDEKVQVIKNDPKVQDFLDGFINLVSADMNSADAGATFEQKLEKVYLDESVKSVLNYFTRLIGEEIEKQNGGSAPASDAPPSSGTADSTAAPLRGPDGHK